VRFRFLTLTTVLALTTAAPAFADDEGSVPSKVLALDVGRFVYSIVQPGNTVLVPLELEFGVLDWLSIYGAPRLAVTQGAVALGLGVGVRFYLIHTPAIRGLWVGPEVSVLQALGTPSGVTASATALNVSGGAGWNFVLGNWLVLSPGVYLGVGGLGTPTPVFAWSPRLVAGVGF
jgi:hypothetical protein